MPASVTPIRPRKPNRRPGALPASASRPRFPGLEEILEDPERAARWMAVFEEAAAARGLPPLAPS
jgi:hypothetical protein